jgi:hypothetical protein
LQKIIPLTMDSFVYRSLASTHSMPLNQAIFENLEFIVPEGKAAFVRALATATKLSSKARSSLGRYLLFKWSATQLAK